MSENVHCFIRRRGKKKKFLLATIFFSLFLFSSLFSPFSFFTLSLFPFSSCFPFPFSPFSLSLCNHSPTCLSEKQDNKTSQITILILLQLAIVQNILVKSASHWPTNMTFHNQITSTRLHTDLFELVPLSLLLWDLMFCNI